MPAFQFFHSCVFLQLLSPEAGEGYFQVEEEYTLPLPPGMRDVHPSDSLLTGWTPHASGYRFRYPRMRNQRPPINDFCRTSLHVEAFRSVLLPKISRSRLVTHTASTNNKPPRQRKNRYQTSYPCHSHPFCRKARHHVHPAERALFAIVRYRFPCGQSAPNRRTCREDRQKT